MWLLFRPTAGTNPIWVPLRKVSWVWTANASYDGATWTINSHSDPTNLSDSDSTNDPTWKVNLRSHGNYETLLSRVHRCLATAVTSAGLFSLAAVISLVASEPSDNEKSRDLISVQKRAAGREPIN